MHFYIPPDTGNIHFSGKRISTNCLTDTDLDYNAPLHIAFDGNAAISSVAIAQPDKDMNVLRTIASMFVKTPNKIHNLVQNICNYYLPKINKEIRCLWGVTSFIRNL